jgi:hypothetical protein
MRYAGRPKPGRQLVSVDGDIGRYLGALVPVGTWVSLERVGGLLRAKCASVVRALAPDGEAGRYPRTGL